MEFIGEGNIFNVSQTKRLEFEFNSMQFELCQYIILLGRGLFNTCVKLYNKIRFIHLAKLPIRIQYQYQYQYSEIHTNLHQINPRPLPKPIRIFG